MVIVKDMLALAYRVAVEAVDDAKGVEDHRVVGRGGGNVPGRLHRSIMVQKASRLVRPG